MKTFNLGIIVALVVACIAVSPALAGGYVDYQAQELQRVVAVQNSEYLLSGYLACHNNLFGQQLQIVREGVDMEPGIIAIRADGYYETTLAEGRYIVTLPDGNGGQAESVRVVCEGQPAGRVSTERPLLGHAATLGEAPAQRHVNVAEATYGKIVLVSAAYDEQVLVQAAYDEYVNVGHNHGDYEKFGQNYFYVGHNHGKYDKVHHDAVYNTVHHAAVFAGSFVDVTAQVQAAVNAGHFALKFDNAQNPGGLFDAKTNALLAQIDDPAPGIEKEVHIVADGKDIDADEYEVINL